MNYPDNIFLVGFSGSGKSTIGPLLAKELNYEFYDTDSMIEEKAGMGITDIFVKGGELKFRKLEAAIIEEIIKNIKQILLYLNPYQKSLVICPKCA